MSNRWSIKYRKMFACTPRSSSVLRAQARYSSSSWPNKELIEHLLKPSAITGDYERTWEGGGRKGESGVAQFRAAVNWRARSVFYGEKITRSRSPCSAVLRGARELRGSPNCTAHRWKVHPYKQSQGRAVRFMMAANENRDPVPLSRAKKNIYNELPPLTGLSLRDPS